MPKSRKSLLGTIGIVVAAALLTAGVIYGPMLVDVFRPVHKVYNRDETEIRRDERKALEKLLKESIEDARKQGKTEAEIEEMKAKFKVEIDKLPQ
jgi:hypothetical protein